ncbi:hypothetical protein [Mesorhizobium sp. M0772]|uniref:hypothetical protein n=1 Tax=Mesorhizobium sp. M0772 TaxID=2956998 RepID=UPI00333B7105
MPIDPIGACAAFLNLARIFHSACLSRFASPSKFRAVQTANPEIRTVICIPHSPAQGSVAHPADRKNIVSEEKSSREKNMAWLGRRYGIIRLTQAC